jgi:hypothetical protein
MMLPYSSRVTFYERAHSNRQWLPDALQRPPPSWMQFWAKIAEGRRPYARFRQPLAVLADRAQVMRGSVSDLSPGRYDLGTMEITTYGAMMVATGR